MAASGSVPVDTGKWSFTPPHLSDGMYTVEATQGDAAGNAGKSSAVTFRVDRTPPVVAVTAPTAGAVLNSSQPTVSGTAGAGGGDGPLVTLKLYAGSIASGSPVQKSRAAGRVGRPAPLLRSRMVRTPRRLNSPMSGQRR